MVGGVVIAMNPNTGEILAMVSMPTYDNQKFSRYIPIDYYTELANDISNPLLNHAISGTYPPGSIFKLTTAVGALNEGIVTPDTPVICRGTISVTQKFHPSDPGPRDAVLLLRPRRARGDHLPARAGAILRHLLLQPGRRVRAARAELKRAWASTGSSNTREALGYGRAAGNRAVRRSRTA